MLRPWGMAPIQFQAYIQGCSDAGISPTRIVQTIGSARASAGTHAQDGIEEGCDYCAATDLSVHDLTTAQILKLALCLCNQGFCPFYRCPGMDGWTGARHMHIVYAGLPMKGLLRNQVHDFLHGLDGLVNQDPYTFFTPSEEEKERIRELFLSQNPENG